MTMIRVSLRGSSTADVVEAAVQAGWLPATEPDHLRSEAPGLDWRERFARTPHDAMAMWGPEGDPDAAVSHIDSVLTMLSARHQGASEGLIERIAALPFEIAAVASIHPEWRTLPESILGYKRPSLGSGMPHHGWLCAFRGNGHARLVSRRWLEFGPWRLHRRQDDVSLVEFHDLAVDWRTALDQARPGHRLMGISPEGGYIQPNHVYSQLPRGFLDSATGLMKVIVHGRSIPSAELLDASALRIESRAISPGPVRNLAYVFPEETEASVHLHSLWLYGLQCWTIRDGKEVRLDDVYRPSPTPPAWV